MAQHGGKRSGAGRRKGAKARATAELKARATQEQAGTLGEMARRHTDVALQTLVDIAAGGEGEAARVSAAQAILDRGYGKAPQPQEHKGKVSVVVKIVNGLGRSRDQSAA